MVHGNRGWSAEECALKVENYLSSFNNKRVMQISSLDEPNVIHMDKWSILCDGSWRKSSTIEGYVAVAMKDECIHMCKVGWQNNCPSSGDAEMKSFLAAVEIAYELRRKEVEFISDSIEVIWFLCSGLGMKGQLKALWHEGFVALSRNL